MAIQQATQIPDSQATITAKQVQTYLGIGRNKYYTLRDTDPDFPKPVSLGRSVMYFVKDIHTYARLKQTEQAGKLQKAKELAK